MAIAWLSHAQPRAQSERVTLPRKPGPNQTLIVHMTQDMGLQMTMANSDPDVGGAQGASQTQRMPPMKLSGMMMIEGRQKVGETDDRGRTPCEFTYTDASMDMKMNGMSMPSQDFKDQFVGKSMSFAYAPDGSVTNLKLPDTPASAGMQATVQQALGAFTLSLPTQPLSIGESAKMPLTVPLALPLPGGATPPAFKGTITYTLVRVEGSGDHRIAVLDQKMDATAAGPLPPPPGGTARQGGANLTMHMTGSGQVRVDLSRGVARSGEIESVMDGTIRRTGGQSQPGMPGDVRLQGSTKMKMSTKPPGD